MLPPIAYRNCGVIFTGSLVDENYYRDVYKGAEVYDDLPTLLDRASDIVRQNTLYRLDDIEKLPSFMRENIKKAVCAQAEFIYANGGLDMLNSGGTVSFSIGKFSMSGGASGNGSSRSPAVSPLMLSYLEAAGLLYRGGGAL
ncbi:MAG: hypothetical protein NC395_11385 [Prevotella sp.]|nr:hypothetical protein [Prevotella sp.]